MCVRRRLVLLRVVLDQAGFLERLVGAVLCDSAKALCGDGDRDRAVELGDEDALALQVHLLADLARRVELRSADAVGIPASDERCFSGYCADFSHIFAHAWYHSS